MSEFEKLLKEHRVLAVQIDDERHFLEHLERQLRSVEKQLKAIAASAQSPSFSTAFDDTTDTDQHDEQNDARSALQDAVKAVAELGDGVTAKQLAQYLNITEDAARLRLQRAARENLISRMAVGRYRAIKRPPIDPKVGSVGRGPNDTEELGKRTTREEPLPESFNGLMAKVD